MKIKAEWQKYYDTLLELHGRLIEQMHGLAKDSAEEMESYSLHMGDSGTDNFDRDFALSLLSSDQDAIYEIEEALSASKKVLTGSARSLERTSRKRGSPRFRGPVSPSKPRRNLSAMAPSSPAASVRSVQWIPKVRARSTPTTPTT